MEIEISGMNKFGRLIAIAVYVLTCSWAEAQMTIAEARTMPSGSVVLIEGIILAGDETSDLRFIQDETAGIALYDGSPQSVSVQSLEKGDRVRIEGEVGSFQGLLELDLITSVEYLSPNNPLLAPKEIEYSDVGILYQSELVKLSCITFEEGQSVFTTGGTKIISSQGSDDLVLEINQGNNAVGKSVPTDGAEIIGISYREGDHAMLLRSYEDIASQECLGFAKLPLPTVIAKEFVEITWTSTSEVQHEIFVGESMNELIKVETKFGSVQATELKNLSPGNLYYLEIQINDGLDTVSSGVLPFVSQSNSSGEIEVYFNNSVDESYSEGSLVDGDSAEEFDQRLFQIIDNAEETIDVAMYNINRTIIVNYLIDAHNRGVRIRYIADDQTSNNAFNSVTPPFGLVYGSTGDPLMHNKFLIVDEGLVSAKVIMGATNFTSNQMAVDPNHMLVINDQSLAKAYTIEFEEMWGSDDEFPNIANARFGSAKEDNTPHFFNINGINVESYFSPSDRVTSKIQKEIDEAEVSIDLALLTITKNELGNALAQKWEEGKSIRLMLENFDDIGSEYNFLLSKNIPIKTHPNSRIFHHKYAIFDEGGSAPRVLTGSHNWTNKAEFENDENTLIIRDQKLANQFRQEYEARWLELFASTYESNFEVSIYPNPASELVYIVTKEDVQFIRVCNAHGQLVGEFQHLNELQTSSWTSGVYFLTLATEKGLKTLTLVKE